VRSRQYLRACSRYRSRDCLKIRFLCQLPVRRALPIPRVQCRIARHRDRGAMVELRASCTGRSADAFHAPGRRCRPGPGGVMAIVQDRQGFLWLGTKMGWIATTVTPGSARFVSAAWQAVCPTIGLPRLPATHPAGCDWHRRRRSRLARPDDRPLRHGAARSGQPSVSPRRRFAPCISITTATFGSRLAPLDSWNSTSPRVAYVVSNTLRPTAQR